MSKITRFSKFLTWRIFLVSRKVTKKCVHFQCISLTFEHSIIILRFGQTLWNLKVNVTQIWAYYTSIGFYLSPNYEWSGPFMRHCVILIWIMKPISWVFTNLFKVPLVLQPSRVSKTRSSGVKSYCILRILN